MEAPSTVLLLESEENVIKDVTCSLRLVDIPVLCTASVAQAKESITASKPALVLARLKVHGDERAGIHLAEELAASKDLAGVSVIILCTPSEKSLIEDKLSLFAGELELPVEFPLFTQRVQRLLEDTPKKSGEESTKLSVVKPAAPAAEQKASESNTASDAASNLMTAYAIQMEVLDELRASKQFEQADKKLVPELIIQLTQKVCEKYRKRG